MTDSEHQRRPEEEGFTGERIPGERDPETLTYRQPGSIGGSPSGADTPSPDPHHLMDEATIRDRQREGGAKVR